MRKRRFRKGVFPSEGSDKEIEYEKLDMNNFTRTRYKVDKSTDDYYAKILSSKRYKNTYMYLYFMLQVIHQKITKNIQVL